MVIVQHETPLTAADLGLSGTLNGTETGEGPAVFGVDDPAPDGGNTDNIPEDAGVDAFVLDGPDAGYFIIDPDTGSLSNIEWFTPQYSQV